MSRRTTNCGIVLMLLGSTVAFGQNRPGELHSANVKVVAHVPLEGPAFDAADIDVEQELSRPYIYVARLHRYGWDAISVKDFQHPGVIYSWEIENSALHEGTGALRP